MKNESKSAVTEEIFKAFDEVRESGLCNMFDRMTATDLAQDMTGIKITKEQYYDIVRNYDEYSSRWGE